MVQQQAQRVAQDLLYHYLIDKEEIKMEVIKPGKDQDGYWEWALCKDCRFTGRANSSDVYEKDNKFYVACPCCDQPLLLNYWAGAATGQAPK